MAAGVAGQPFAKEKGSINNGKVLSDRNPRDIHSTNCDINQTYQNKYEAERNLEPINQPVKESSPLDQKESHPESVPDHVLPHQLSGRENHSILALGLLGDRVNQEYTGKCRSQEFYLAENQQNGCQSNQVEFCFHFEGVPSFYNI